MRRVFMRKEAVVFGFSCFPSQCDILYIEGKDRGQYQKEHGNHSLILFNKKWGNKLEVGWPGLIQVWVV